MNPALNGEFALDPSSNKVHHIIDLMLGVSALEGDSLFINRYLPAPYVLSHQADPVDNLQPAIFPITGEGVQFFGPFKELLFETHQSVMRLGVTILGNNINPQVKPADGYSFPESFELPCLRSVGGDILKIPSINLSSRVMNPLDGTFTKEEAICVAQKLQDNIYNMC